MEQLPTAIEVAERMRRCLAEAGYPLLAQQVRLRVGACRTCGADSVQTLHGAIDRLTEEENRAMAAAFRLAGGCPIGSSRVIGYPLGECGCTRYYRPAEDEVA